MFILFNVVVCHLRLSYNWFNCQKNKFVLLIILLLPVLVIGFLLNNLLLIEGTAAHFGACLLIGLLPHSILKPYQKFISKEEVLFSNLLYQKQILLIQKRLSLLLYYMLAILLLFLVNSDKLQMNSYLIITALVVLYSLFINYNINAKARKSDYKKPTKSFWFKKDSPLSLLPIRAVVLREILFLFRKNRIGLIKYFFYNVLVTGFTILYYSNNSMTLSLSILYIIQSVFLLSFLLDSSSYSETQILSYTNYKRELFLGATAYSFLVLSIQFVFVSLFAIALPLEVAINSIYVMLFSYMLLGYALIIRFRYLTHDLLRPLIFVVSIATLTAPYFIYRFIKEVK